MTIDIVAVTQAQTGVREQRAETLLALDRRAFAQILFAEMEKIEQKKTTAATLPLPDANRTVVE